MTLPRGTSQVRGGRKVQFDTSVVPPAPADPRGPNPTQPFTPAPQPPPSTKPTHPLYLPGPPPEERPAQSPEQAQGPAPAAHVVVQHQQQLQPTYTQSQPPIFTDCSCMICNGTIIPVGDNVIGVGGQAKVYKFEYAQGQHQGFRAVKVFSDRDNVDDLYKTAVALKKELGPPHLNILEYLNIFLCTKNRGKEACIVTPFCEGGDLYNKTRTNKGLPEKEVRDVMRQVGEGLKHMHLMGLVHSDVKPENILIATGASGECVYKLADLDSSGIIRDGKTHFSIKFITRRFGSPGMLLGHKARVKDDIWCLGTTALVLLTGKERTNTYAYDLQDKENFREEIEAWVRQGAVVSQELMDIIFRMLEQRVDDRPSAEELLALLDRTALGGGTPAPAAGAAPVQGAAMEAGPPDGLRASAPPAPVPPPAVATELRDRDAATAVRALLSGTTLPTPPGASAPLPAVGGAPEVPLKHPESVAAAPPDGLGEAPPPAPVDPAPLAAADRGEQAELQDRARGDAAAAVRADHHPHAAAVPPTQPPPPLSRLPTSVGWLFLAIFGVGLSILIPEGHLYRVHALVSPPKLVQEEGRYVIKGAGLPRKGENKLAEKLVNGATLAILPLLEDEWGAIEDIFSLSASSARALRDFLQPYIAFDDKTGRRMESEYINYGDYPRQNATQTSRTEDYAWSMQLALYMVQRNVFKALPEEVATKAMEDLGAPGKSNFHAFNPVTYVPERVLRDLRAARRQMTPDQIAECKASIRTNLNYHLRAYGVRVSRGESFGEWAREHLPTPAP